MRFDFDFYSSLLLIFFVHTTVYSFLFFIRFKRQGIYANFWLGLFLLLAALYIAPWMLGFAGWYAHQPYRDIMFYTPFQHLYLVGPCIFFYVQSLFNPHFKITKKHLLHFIPSMLYVLFCVVMVTYDKWVVHQYYFLKNEQDPDFDNWYQITGFISMIIYFLASIKYYNLYKKAIREVISHNADFLFLWVRNFLVAFLSILVAWLVVAICELFIDMPFSARWWYFLSFAIACYYIAIAGYSNAVEIKVFFKTKKIFKTRHALLLQYKTRPLFLEYTQEKFETLTIADIKSATFKDAEGFKDWKIKIEQLLLTEKIYQQPDLTLFEVAKKLNTNISFLSRVINTAFGSNFNDLINNYRVRSVMDLLSNGMHKRQTLLSIAFECGFNSKSTFNRAFKKFKGVTPQEYIRQHLT